MNNKISVIIPVSNTPYDIFNECIDSLLNQSFKEYEIIIVDDYSTNTDTLRVIDKIKMNDNVFVLRPDHKIGAAKARNKGLSLSNSKYVIFLDSDDVFDSNMLNIMYDEIERNKGDICVCGYRLLHNNRKLELKEMQYDERFLCRIPLNPWTKLCRRKFLIDNGIYFQDLSSSNDVYFSCMAMMLSRKIIFLEKETLIRYRIGNHKQISSKRDPMNFAYAINSVAESMEQRGMLSEKVKQMIVALLIEGGMSEIRDSKSDIDRNNFYQFCKDILNSYQTEFLGEKLRTYYKFWIKENRYNWIFNIGDYGTQIKESGNEIFDLLSGKDNIFLWGIGERGRAFIEWCSNNSIFIRGIYDEDNSKSKYFDLCDFNYLRNNANVVIASNHKAYCYINNLYGSLKHMPEIIDLEIFCEL